MYFFDNQVSEIASQLKPSPRGELEITDIIRTYLAAGKLTMRVLGHGIAWLDAGTYESLLQASSFVQAVQERQGLMICCPEEITFQQGFIGRDQKLTRLARFYELLYSTSSGVGCHSQVKKC